MDRAIVPGYARDILAMADQPGGLLPALNLALVAPDQSLDELAAKHAESDSADLQIAASCLRLQTVSSNCLEDIVLGCMDHPVYVVKRAACMALSRAVLPSGAVADRLRKLIREEVALPTLEEACAALVRIGGPREVEFIYDCLSAKGDGALGCALPSLCSFPSSRWRGYLEGLCRSTDHDAAILASRGLILLGDQVSARHRSLAGFQTDAEFGRAMEEAESDQVLVESSYEAMMGELSEARVLVVGELHDIPWISAAEVFVAHDWAVRRPDRSVEVVYEEPVKESQYMIRGWANALGLSCYSVEAGPMGRSAYERDCEARLRLLELARAKPEAVFLVVYGDAHRPSFVKFLNANGIVAKGLSLAVGGRVLTRAIKAADALDIRGAVFRCDADNWCLPVCSWASFGSDVDHRIARLYCLRPR